MRCSRRGVPSAMEGGAGRGVSLIMAARVVREHDFHACGGVLMVDHYYTDHPTGASDPRDLEATVRGCRLRLTVDRGVFSRRGIDFGSRLLAETIVVQGGDRLLDLGCGYGVVGIALACDEPGLQVVAADVNERAVSLAHRNIAANGLAGRMAAVCADGAREVAPGLVFDVIALNPPVRAGKAVVWRLYGEAAARLAVRGALWVVIQKKQGADSTRRRLEELFAEVAVVRRDGGYRVFRATAPRESRE